MAVVTRQNLQTQEAQDITKKALAQASLYNPAISQLQQQSTILSGQQQNLIQSTQETIGDVNRNIYQSQRRQKAQSAALGMVGTVEAGRAATELQGQISYELGNIVSQANQGAVSIASQQSAINKAEVMNAQQEILNIFADELIESGDPSVQQDVGGQVMAGLTGALAGGFAGMGIGQFGPKFLSGSLKSSSLFRTGATGVAAGLGINAAATQVATIGKDYWSEEAQEGYEDNFWTEHGKTVTGIAGAAGGAGLGLFNAKYKKDIAKEFVPGKWTTGLRKNPGRFKLFNPTPIGLALGGAGAIIGGLSAGLNKKYTLDYDKLMQSGTAQDFASMGIDLTAMSDLIKGR